ncbi:MAG: hypothetical protein A3J79_05315 [Elusimicrobia bacterium RIFOXYB2_FULL_62_6]|nr:MAG: hypothetical protein A3J79_05315 [Elusimicrobia bacterium RIFOXYB2_FULL_62_6]
MKNIRIFVFAALPALALAAACQNPETPKATVPAAEATVETGPADAPAPAAKQPEAAPAKAQTPAAAPKAYEKQDTYFTLPDTAGGQMDLAAYAGKPVLLMFFTETCPYCTKAAPFIEKMNKDHKAAGLSVLGVSLNNDPSYALGFAKRYGITFPLAYQGGKVARQYNARGVPFIFLLNKNHTVYNVWAGYDEAFDPEIANGIAEVLK